MSTNTTSIVSAIGNYLYKEDGTRFFVKGIAFPVPLKPHDYNETAWIGILRQLKVGLKLDINAVRLYRMDPSVDYSGFFDYAASVGIYVIVPLTSDSGAGVLDRDKPAPKCYSRKLFQYGVASLRNFMQYPNTLAGVVGNEVMNSLSSWLTAPCVKAYVRDLKAYMDTDMNRNLPLLYTAQNSGFGASVTADQAMFLTANYLTCTSEGEDNSSIDIFGVNVESWCSSTGTFQENDDGSVGSYYTLWKTLHNISVAVVFAEMGCPQSLFNRDNGLEQTRDWKQVPVVLNQMADTWSGFCAYAYDGSVDFNMFDGGPWDGRNPLVPKKEFFHFRDQLEKHGEPNSTVIKAKVTPPTCTSVAVDTESCCDGVFRLHNVTLYNVDKITSYSHSDSRGPKFFGAVMILGTMFLIVSKLRRHRERKFSFPRYENGNKELSPLVQVQYQSINRE
jgi:hypothetical protein